MKKIMMVFAALMVWGGMLHAQTYDYLTFQTTNGALHSVKAAGLVISFADGQMNAQAGSETLTLSLSDLTRMYFSDTDGVDMTHFENTTAPIDVFGTDGRQMGTYQGMDAVRTGLKPGAYILKTAGKTLKMMVK